MRAFGSRVVSVFVVLGCLALGSVTAFGDVVPDPYEAFTLSAQMRRWSRLHVPLTGSERDRLRALDRSLAAPPRGLLLREVDDWSGDARDVFAKREADCVGYAILFYALAQDAEIPVEFVIEEKVDSVEERPGVEVLRRHLAIAHRGSKTVWDFSGERTLSRTLHHTIEPATAVAILESNRGAQALLAEDLPKALTALSRATEIDPRFGPAWSNLAVALRRVGAVDEAEGASLRALELELDAAQRRRRGGRVPTPR